MYLDGARIYICSSRFLLGDLIFEAQLLLLGDSYRTCQFNRRSDGQKASKFSCAACIRVCESPVRYDTITLTKITKLVWSRLASVGQDAASSKIKLL